MWQFVKSAIGHTSWEKPFLMPPNWVQCSSSMLPHFPDLAFLTVHALLHCISGLGPRFFTPKCLFGKWIILSWKQSRPERLRKKLWPSPSVQFNSVTQSCPTLCNPMDCSKPGFPVHHHSQSLLKLMSIKSVMPSNHLTLCCPLPLLPSIFPSIRVFFNESVLHVRWPKYWSFSFSISPSKEYSGFISFRIDRFDLLAVQGTLKSLFQQHSSKTSILQCSAFFMVQLSHPYMTTKKTHGFE